jgi:D-threonate/D-erythronate kinase
VSRVSAVLVIADDLTGANATGALFARLGLRTRTLAAGSGQTCSPQRTDVTVVTTGTRRLPPKAAAARVAEVLGGQHDPQLLVKRVDTTLRGPIAAELAVMLAHRRGQRPGRVAALAVPAYPAAGRITVGGLHLLDGTPLARGPAAVDPVTPVHSSRVAELLVAGTPLTAAEVHLDVLDGDDHAVAETLAAALDSADVTVVDAATDADLARLAAAAASIRPDMADIVAVDSGPFGAAYCDALGITAQARRHPVLVVVGSPAEKTRRQLEAATHATGARIHMVGEDLGSGEVAALAIDAIDAGAAVVGWHVPPLSPDRDRTWAQQVPSWLAAAARQVLAARQVAGVFACGGEVAAATLDGLQARGLDITAEVQPLVVAGRIIGGPWNRLPIVTKGGLVGDENAITASIGHLHSMREALLGTTEAVEVLRP